jgi:hypothetical protein
MTMLFRSTAALLLLVANFCAEAYAQTVERTAQGESGKDIQVGTYVNIRPDCTSGPLPTIRLTGSPAHGKITVKKATLNATNYKQCLALTVPAYVAFYRADKDFLGTDTVTLDVKYPEGKQETQHITVTIRSPGARQPI